MWPWIKRWRDWAMHDLWFMHRIGPQPQALHFSYEKAGLTLHDQPIPWNAEAVLVEASLRLPPAVARRKADFQVCIPSQEPVPAETINRHESGDHHRLFFRMKPPTRTGIAEVRWRNHSLGQLTLPILSQEEFIQNLRLQLATVFVRLGDQNVACQTFVSTQSRGLTTSALLTSPTSLVPLLDLGLQIEIKSERGGPPRRAPVSLSSSQLAERQALVAVIPRGFPRRMGTWTVSWLLGDRPLATQRIRAISQRHFRRSLRVTDARFVIHKGKGSISLSRQVPNLEGEMRVGPCFLVSSSEPGMAGMCPLQIRLQVQGAILPPLMVEQEILITDGPTMVAPGTLNAADLAQISAFELQLKAQTLGLLSLSPIPVANFTAEGAFKPPSEFSWSGSAEEELNERLARLLDGRPNGDAK